MKLFGLLILALVYSSISIAQSLPMGIDSFTSKSSKESVYLTILRAKRNSRKASLIPYLPCIMNKRTHSLFPHKGQNEYEFIIQVKNSYEKSNEKAYIIKIFGVWENMDELINCLGDLNPEFPPEAILYFTKQTKPLFDIFFNSKSSKRDWSSLSSYESYELNISFLNYSTGLSQNQLNKLVSNLRKTTQKLLHSNEKFCQ